MLEVGTKQRNCFDVGRVFLLHLRKSLNGKQLEPLADKPPSNQYVVMISESCLDDVSSGAMEAHANSIARTLMQDDVVGCTFVEGSHDIPGSKQVIVTDPQTQVQVRVAQSFNAEISEPIYSLSIFTRTRE